MLLVVAAALATGGCDGGIDLDVFVRTAAGLTQSRAYANTPPPALAGLQSLDSAQVEIVENPGALTAAGRRVVGTASVTGRYHYFATACACEFDVQVTVRRRGFQPVVQTFRHTTTKDVVVAILAPGR